MPHVSHGSKIGKYKSAYSWTPSRIVSAIGVALTRAVEVKRLTEVEAAATTRSMIKPKKKERIVCGAEIEFCTLGSCVR